MSHEIIVISWSHQHAPLNFRDKLTLSRKEIKQCIHLFTNSNKIIELAILSTCNRIEFYFLSKVPEDLLITIKNYYTNILKRKISWNESAPIIYSGMEAAQHICRVASGMESMILGEHQILSQVSLAQHILISSHPEVDVLSRLFNDAIDCAKTVHAEHLISMGPTSVSELAIQIAQQNIDHIEDRKVLLIGAGETAELAAHHLKTLGVNKIIIANRSEKRGRALAESISADYINVQTINDAIRHCDIIVSAIYAENYLIETSQIENIMQGRKNKLLLMDISTPRTLEPSISDINNVYFYDLDHMHNISSINRKKKKVELARAEIIIQKYSQIWMDWFQLESLREVRLELSEESV